MGTLQLVSLAEGGMSKGSVFKEYLVDISHAMTFQDNISLFPSHGVDDL